MQIVLIRTSVGGLLYTTFGRFESHIAHTSKIASIAQSSNTFQHTIFKCSRQVILTMLFQIP